MTQQQLSEYLNIKNKLVGNFERVMLFEILQGIYTIEQLKADVELFFSGGRLN